MIEVSPLKKLKVFVASYIKHRMLENRKRKSDPKYRKYEFSKKVTLFCCFMMIVAFFTSVHLSLNDKDTISDITVAVFTVCGSGIMGYIVKSAFEKNSRNKYGLDEFGNPIGSTEIKSENDKEETEEEIYG